MILDDNKKKFSKNIFFLSINLKIWSTDQMSVIEITKQ